MKEVARLAGGVAVNDDATVTQLRRDRAGNMAAELFGVPDKRTFTALLHKDIRTARAATDGQSPQKAAIAEEFLTMVDTHEPLMPEHEINVLLQRYELSDKTITVVRGDLQHVFPNVQHMYHYTAENPTAASTQKAKRAFQTALGMYGLTRKGWRVVVGNHVRSAETHGASKTVEYGRHRKDFSPTALRGVPVHEATHALRIQNMSEQPQAYLQNALPGSLPFDEGFCMAIEQIVTGNKRLGGQKYYLQQGLMLGLDKHSRLPDQFHQRTFRQVWDIIQRREVLLTDGDVDGHDMVTKAIASAQRTAYSSITRTTRGNSLDTRDISYMEGAMRAHVFLNQTAVLPA